MPQFQGRVKPNLRASIVASVVASVLASGAASGAACGCLTGLDLGPVPLRCAHSAGHCLFTRGAFGLGPSLFVCDVDRLRDISGQTTDVAATVSGHDPADRTSSDMG